MAKEKQTKVAYTGQGQRQRRSGALKAHLEKRLSSQRRRENRSFGQGKGHGRV